jgi:hypothetical protein
MKLVQTTPLLDTGGFTSTSSWPRIKSNIEEAIDAVRWPPGADKFTIYRQSGKKTGEGNGVKPIKEGFITKLVELGWLPEGEYPSEENAKELTRPGAFDARLNLVEEGLAPFVVEWETGNISSSHRAMNKMALAMLAGRISGGILVLPTRALYHFLTDRVGNYPELAPYFPMWSALPITKGYLAVIAVEHDAASTDVPRIAKGTDGRALV